MSCKVCRRSLLKTTAIMPKLTTTSMPSSPGKNDVILPTKILLCSACKKFYWRCQKNPLSNKACVCKGLEVGSKLDVNKCKPCRFRRCQEACGDNVSKLIELEDLPNRPEPTFKLSKEAFSKIPCAVCSSPSSGIHYGVFACGACSVFFRRCASGMEQAACKSSANNEGSCCQKDKCRSCRFARCVSAGMSLQNRCGGRMSRRRYEVVCSAIAKNEAEHASVISRRSVKRTVSETSTSPSGDSGNFSGTLDISSDCTTSTMDCSTSTDSPETCDRSNDSTEDSAWSDSVMTSYEEPFGSNESSTNANDYESEATVDRNDAATLDQPNQLWISQTQDFSKWLIDRTVTAVSRLAPIASHRAVLSEEMPQEQIASLKSEAFANYLKCVGEFLKNLPGMENVAVDERISIYLESFFPILVAELSLTNQAPTTLLLHRNGDWRIIDASIEAFLVEAGNRMAAVVSNIEEFSLLCALLCFFDTSSSNGAISSIGRCYKLAVLQHLSLKGLPDRKLLEFIELASFLRQANIVLHRYAEELASQSSLLCRNNTDSARQSLVSQFCEQFLSRSNGPQT